MVNPHEFLWLKGRVYSLECKLQKLLQLLEENSKTKEPIDPLTEKAMRILRGQPVD